MSSVSPGVMLAPVGQPQRELKSSQERPFFGRIESLRGIGAMAVATHHLSGMKVGAHSALMLFFVMSGFLLRFSLQHGPQKLFAAAAKFTLGRLFRVYPVVIFGVLLLAVLCKGEVHPHGAAARPLTAPLLCANLLLLDVSLNDTYWALRVELLMVPVLLLLYFLERSRGPYVLLGIALATSALAFSSEWAVWPPLSINMFAFVLGMVIPTLGRRFAISLSKPAATCSVLGVVAVMLFTGLCFGFYSRASTVIEAYAATVLVSLAAYRHDLSVLKWLEVRPLRLLGLASGSYYVLHMATIPAALTIGGALIPAQWSADFPTLVAFLILPPWLVVMALLALCSYYLIEAPGIALGRRVAHWCRLDTRRVSSPGSEQGTPRLAA